MIFLQQGKEKTTTKWTQLYFSDYLSDIGGLFTSLMAGARLSIMGYQSFYAQKSMIRYNYGHEDSDEGSGADRPD